MALPSEKRFWMVYLAALTLALCLILLPLFVAAFSYRPICDDLGETLSTVQVVKDDGSLWDVFVAACQHTVERWQGWYGIYFSMFVTCLPLTIFSNGLAFVHPILFLLMLVGACFRLVFCLRLAWPKISKTVAACAALTLSIAMVLLMPCMDEGIFWYSGAVSYTFMFTLAVFFFCSLFSMCSQNKPFTFSRGLRLALLCVAFFLIGGMSFCVSTVSVSLSAVFFLYMLLTKKKKIYALPFALLLAGYCLAVFAPGNAFRQVVEKSPHLSLTRVFLQSFVVALKMIFQNGELMTFSLFFLPVSVALSRCVVVRRKCLYLLIPLVLYLLVTASCVSPVYGFGQEGAGRIVNIHFFLSCIFWFAVITLAACWVRCELCALGGGAPEAGRQGFTLRRGLLYLLCVCVAFFGIGFAPSIRFDPFRLKTDYAPVKAVAQLMDGEVRTFASQYDEIVDYIKEHPGEDISVPYNPQAYLFGNTGIANTGGWSGIFARYYGAASIVLNPDEPIHSLPKAD